MKTLETNRQCHLIQEETFDTIDDVVPRCMKLFSLHYYLGVPLTNLSPCHRMIILGKGRAFCDKVCGEKSMATDACCDSPSRDLLLPRHELHVHSADVPDEKRTPFAAGYAGEVPMGPSKKRPNSPIGPKPGIARKQLERNSPDHQP